MRFYLKFTAEAKATLTNLSQNEPKKYQKVLKTLGLMEVNLRHPSLKTHKYTSLKGLLGEEVFEAYVENKTPGAYRVFWYYGPNRDEITILTITHHP